MAVLLVDGCFLPTREHNDEVELANAVFGRTFRLHFSQGLQKIFVFILFAFVHELECLGLFGDEFSHLFVAQHRGLC